MVARLVARLTALTRTVWPALGSRPSGARLDRIKRSPHYRDGRFHNLPTKQGFKEASPSLKTLSEFLFGSRLSRIPPTALPVVHTSFTDQPAEANVVVWLGHSSFYMRLAGMDILVDPVFGSYAAPVPLFIRAFEGPYPFSAADMPHIDLLLLTHDHFDHTDYPTLKGLRSKVRRVITPLGVGTHLEGWGYKPANLHELDWYEQAPGNATLTVHAVPALHFSGRGMSSNETLWTGYVLKTDKYCIYVSGDSGYGDHYAQIGERFGPFDLAIIENGQYNEEWSRIHNFPEQVAQAAVELRAKALLPCHAGRFALSLHAWDEPYRRLKKASDGQPYVLKTPRMGEVVDLANPRQVFASWWEQVTP